MSTQIDYIMLMNLERRIDKWWYALGHLTALNYPVKGNERKNPQKPWSDQIIRFISHDGRVYDSTQTVIDAAVDDGWLFLKNILKVTMLMNLKNATSARFGHGCQHCVTLSIWKIRM